MKRTLSLLLFAFCSLLMTKAAFATTWYVRPDGGTRYSSVVTSGQCDGLADVAYPGSGHNQHCAFNDVRFFWQDGSYAIGNGFPAWGWVGAGGDTYLIRGSLANKVTYRIGWNNPNSSYDPSTEQFWGLQGNPYASGMPAPPSGTANAHTRLLGENYASCSAASAKTQIHGGYGLYSVLNMSGASYVDVACLDVTDFSSCSLAGGATVTCDKNIGELSDFAGTGIAWNNTSTHDTLTDVHVHGLALNGLYGPTGDGTVFTNLDIIGNSDAGWNADAADGSNGIGSLLVQNFNISWNGCTEEYPIVDAVPYSQCSDDSSGGYGDGFGTATAVTVPQGWQVHFDQGTVSYNTQDGLDALHLVGNNSSMTITRVLAYGNMGQQIKVGGAKGTAENNVVVTNCNALRQAIPGTPSGYNNNLSDFCRAADTGVLVTVGKGSLTTFDNNTIYSASATGIEVECDTSNGNCDGTSLIDFRNNIFLGFTNNPANGYTGQYDKGTLDNSNPIYDGTGLWPFGSSGSQYSNNIIFHPKSNFNCPASGQICVDPVLTDESWHNYGFPAVTPLAGSPAIAKGVSIAGISLDFSGLARTALPTIGAIEVAGAAAQSTTTTTTSSNPVNTTSPATTPTSTTSTSTSTGSSTTPALPTKPSVPAGPAATQFTLSVSKGSTKANPLVLTATLKATTGTVPTGSIIIFSSAHWPLAAGVLDKNGSVSFQVPAALTSQIVYGVYAGNANFKASTSALLSGPAALASVGQ